jgi:hypothetical protein
VLSAARAGAAVLFLTTLLFAVAVVLLLPGYYLLPLVTALLFCKHFAFCY